MSGGIDQGKLGKERFLVLVFLFLSVFDVPVSTEAPTNF